MHSRVEEASVKPEPPQNQYTNSRFALQEPVQVSSSSPSSSDYETEDDDSVENTSKQLVLYDPAVANGTGSGGGGGEIVPVPQPLRSQACLFGKQFPSRALPSVGAFTVQCASCFKWRLIPTKEKYEEIRERILEQPFYCETAREWRPDVSCAVEADLEQGGDRLWAIDKPNIAKPPRGWQRLLRIRGEGSTKFADVYYIAPSGKKLRSMVEVQKYLIEHPEYTKDGVTMSRFSFQIPRPLQKDYVRKRPARISSSCDNARPLGPGEVNPLSWVGPHAFPDLQLGRQTFPRPPSFQAPESDSVERPAKQAKRTLS